MSVSKRAENKGLINKEKEKDRDPESLFSYGWDKMMIPKGQCSCLYLYHVYNDLQIQPILHLHIYEKKPSEPAHILKAYV